ncbi:MAG: diadenylate cyclase CdaA [Nitrospira sp.]|nr:diadenylate cyclase CdaA [Nitrospira sp.]
MPEPFNSIRWQDFLDVLVVAFILYWLFITLKGTLALKMLTGLAMLLTALVLAKWMGLYTVDWLVTGFWSQIVLALVILFHPEIRRALAKIGQSPFNRAITEAEESRTIDEIVKASAAMANKRVGAILVLERDIDLKDVVEMGIPLDAVVSKELLTSLFLPTSPLHDGAAIIKGGRIVAVGCFLPLTLRADTSPLLGTRHRAALGVTEETDALVIVVSEEAGSISVIIGGKMTREVDTAGLRRVLTRNFLKSERREESRFRHWIRTFIPDRFKATGQGLERGEPKS